MYKVNTHKLGLVVGSFVGLSHLIWSLFVALGWAGPLVGFILGLHFMSHPYMVLPFNLITAVELVIVTFFVGYVGATIAGIIWNRIYVGK